MSGFDARWLDLREPADARARAEGLVRALRRAARIPRHEVLRIVDLGAGTGANLRYMAPHLGGRQHWQLVDRDLALLAAVARRMHTWQPRRGLAQPRWRAEHRLEHADLRRAIAGIARQRPHLICASALLDLVGRDWLLRALRRCAKVRSAMLFALSYDGRVRLWPHDPLDAEVIALVNRHQRRDKGLGPALGPDAWRIAARQCVALGYRTRHRRSDWVLEPCQAALQGELIEGWAEAAGEMAPERAGDLRRWCERRRQFVAQGRSRMRVGHRDLLAVPR